MSETNVKKPLFELNMSWLRDDSLLSLAANSSDYSEETCSGNQLGCQVSKNLKFYFLFIMFYMRQWKQPV